MSKEIEHKYTDNVICPYCGHENLDSWELLLDSDEIDCECGNKFEYERYVSVTYSTSKPTPERE